MHLRWGNEIMINVLQCPRYVLSSDRNQDLNFGKKNSFWGFFIWTFSALENEERNRIKSIFHYNIDTLNLDLLFWVWKVTKFSSLSIQGYFLETKFDRCPASSSKLVTLLLWPVWKLVFLPPYNHFGKFYLACSLIAFF